MCRKKVFIWADADQEIGFGHFIRCIALADMLKNDFDCYFFTKQPTDYQKNEVAKIAQLCVLPADGSRFDIFLNRIEGNEIVVLDNYFFSSEYQKAVKRKGCKLVMLGSNDRHYYADIVINYTNLKPEVFSVESYTKLCIGLEWTLLRPPFYKAYIAERTKHSYAICIGGTDQFCYAEKFSRYIRDLDPKAIITVISTDRIGANRIRSMQKAGCLMAINQTAEQMAELFLNNEIVIVSASGVAVEALSQKANVIAGHYVDNQINIYNTFVDGDFIWPLGEFSDSKVYSLLEYSIRQIQQGNRKNVLNSENTVHRYIQLFKNL